MEANATIPVKNVARAKCHLRPVIAYTRSVENTAVGVGKWFCIRCSSGGDSLAGTVYNNSVTIAYSMMMVLHLRCGKYNVRLSIGHHGGVLTAIERNRTSG